MKQMSFYGAVMLLILTFSSTSAESIPAPALLPHERTIITADNLNEIKRLATWGSGHIYDAAWMDSQHIAFTSDVGTWVYELDPTPIPIRLFTPPAQTVFAVPNRDWVITYTDSERFDTFSDNALTAWNLNGDSQQLLAVSRVLGTPESLRSPVMRSYGAMGGYIVGSQGADVYLWPDDFSSEPLHFAQPASSRTDYIIEMAALSSDSKRLATVARAFLSDQLIISVWDTDSGQRHVLYQDDYLPLNRLYLYNLQFSTDGHELVATLGEMDEKFHWENRVARWEVPSGKALEPLELLCADRNNNVTTVGVTPGLYAADLYLCNASPSTNAAGFEIRSIKTGQLQASVAADRYDFIPVFSPNMQYMALSKAAPISSGSWFPYRIVIWDIAHDRLSAEFEVPTGSVAALAFSPDGQRLLAATSKGKVFIWDMDAQAQTYVIESGHSLPVTSVAFSPDGRWLVSAATTPYTVTNSYDAPGGFVARWNLETSQYERLLDGADVQVQSVVFSPDGKYLYLGDLDGNLRIWDSETFVPLDIYANPDPIRNMSFNSDGSLLAVAGDGQVTIWNTQTRTIINRLQGSSGSGYCKAQFSADDNWLKLCNKAWKVENHGKLIAAWNVTTLPQAVQDWVWADEGKLAFPSVEGDGTTVYATPVPYFEPREASIAFNPTHDLIALGRGSGVIEVYGIQEGGS